MNRRQFCRAVGALSLLPLTTLMPSSTASAYVVFDPSNFGQNILQAIRLLQSNVNEARQIANQVMSLANDARNLASLPFDVINDYSNQFNRLFTTVGTINGLMQNLTNLESRFEELYPDLQNQWDPVSRQSMADDMKKWLTATRETMLGAAKTGAQVLESLPQTQAQLAQLMSSSQGAVGILQATQAGTQIAGTIAGQLINLNAQLATYSQAHTSYLMSINSSAEAARNRMDHVLDGWSSGYAGKPIKENPF